VTWTKIPPTEPGWYWIRNLCGKRHGIKKQHNDVDVVILIVVPVDAACAGNPGILEYRGVLTHNKQEIFRKGPFKNGTNNVGEFLALVHALAFLSQHRDEKMKSMRN
jgi:viroplasmin and RNaseH domain-containing protein